MNKKIHLLCPKGLLYSGNSPDELREAANRFLAHQEEIKQYSIMDLHVTDDNDLSFTPFYQWLANEAGVNMVTCEQGNK